MGGGGALAGEWAALLFVCVWACPGGYQGTSSALHAYAVYVLRLSISGPFELLYKVVVHRGPGFSTSEVHYSVQFAKQVSPRDPASPRVRVPNSVRVSELRREVTLVATGSVTKSFAFDPPTVFGGASF